MDWAGYPSAFYCTLNTHYRIVSYRIAKLLVITWKLRQNFVKSVPSIHLSAVRLLNYDSNNSNSTALQTHLNTLLCSNDLISLLQLTWLQWFHRPPTCLTHCSLCTTRAEQRSKHRVEPTAASFCAYAQPEWHCYDIMQIKLTQLQQNACKQPLVSLYDALRTEPRDLDFDL